MTAQAGDTLFSSAAERKQQLRRQMRMVRRGLGLAYRRRAALRASQRLLRLVRQLRCRAVAIHLSMHSELSTAPLVAALHARGVRVYVPLVHPRRGAMSFVRLRPGACRLRQRRPAPAPAGRALRQPRRLPLIVLPLLAFDPRGGRLGQGGGYYDRALRPFRGRRPLHAGYAFAVQQVDAVPAERWDRPLHLIVTELGTKIAYR